jgi:hypothetical protein
MDEYESEIDAAAAIHLETALYALASGDTPRAVGALLSITAGSWAAIRARLRDPLTYALVGGPLAALVDQLPAESRAVLLGEVVAPDPMPDPTYPDTALGHRHPSLPGGAPADPAPGPEPAVAPTAPAPRVSAEALAACFGGAALPATPERSQPAAVSAA